jgi:hypothetical protein
VRKTTIHCRKPSRLRSRRRRRISSRSASVNLGVLYRDTGRLADAAKAFSEALTIYREIKPLNLLAQPSSSKFQLLAGNALVQFSEQFHSPVRRRGSGQHEDALIGCPLHQHKFHLSEVYGLRRDQAGRILLKNDGLVFHEGE